MPGLPPRAIRSLAQELPPHDDTSGWSGHRRRAFRWPASPRSTTCLRRRSSRGGVLDRRGEARGSLAGHGGLAATARHDDDGISSPANLLDSGPGWFARTVFLGYEIADGIWIPTEDSFLHPEDWTQQQTKWNRDCIRCHSVGPHPNFDFESRDWETEVTELGIACAGCHGPAEEHIRSHHNPLHRHRMRASDVPDPTIVNPA